MERTATPIPMTRLPTLLAPFAALLVLTGCDATSLGDAQRIFELQAVSTPSGYTETDADGRVIRDDPSDWRAAPIYASEFFVTFKPYPNPASATENIQFAASFSGPSGGLEPYRLSSRGDLVRIEGVTGNTSGTAPLFSFPAGQLGDSGLQRVVLLDLQGRIVSYGDILVIP